MCTGTGTVRYRYLHAVMAYTGTVPGTVPECIYCKHLFICNSETVLKLQCCGSGMISTRIPVPAEFHSGSLSRIWIPDPAIKEKGQLFKTAPRASLMS
jgi:hypothetical protein